MSEYVFVNGELRSLDSINDSELMHYGVIGMKWGIRRARKKGVDYAYRSHGQKKYEKRLAKQKAKGVSAKKIAKTKETLEIFKQRDLNREEFARKTTVGREIVKSLLMSPIGARSYNRMAAAGYSSRMAIRLHDDDGSVWTSRRLELDAARRQVEMRKKYKNKR